MTLGIHLSRGLPRVGTSCIILLPAHTYQTHPLWSQKEATTYFP
jgi:hypothetical protein